jgi:hypothetical protein
MAAMLTRALLRGACAPGLLKPLSMSFIILAHAGALKLIVWQWGNRYQQIADRHQSPSPCCGELGQLP